MFGFDEQLKRLLGGRCHYGCDRDFLKRARYFRENAGLEWVAYCDEVLLMQLPQKRKRPQRRLKESLCHGCQKRRSKKRSFAAWNGPPGIWICEECHRWLKFAEDNADKVNEAVKKIKVRELTEGSDSWSGMKCKKVPARLMARQNRQGKVSVQKNDRVHTRSRWITWEVEFKNVRALMARKNREDSSIFLSANHSKLKSPGPRASVAVGRSIQNNFQNGKRSVVTLPGDGASNALDHNIQNNCQSANRTVLRSPGLAAMAPGPSDRRYGQQGYGKAIGNPADPSDRRYKQAGYRAASDPILITDKGSPSESIMNPKCTNDLLLINDKRFQPGGIRNPICL